GHFSGDPAGTGSFPRRHTPRPTAGTRSRDLVGSGEDASRIRLPGRELQEGYFAEQGGGDSRHDPERFLPVFQEDHAQDLYGDGHRISPQPCYPTTDPNG